MRRRAVRRTAGCLRCAARRRVLPRPSAPAPLPPAPLPPLPLGLVEPAPLQVDGRGVGAGAGGLEVDHLARMLHGLAFEALAQPVADEGVDVGFPYRRARAAGNR